MEYNWSIEEDKWNEKFKWFLIDDGKIQYSFLSQSEALLFQKKGHLNYMLLTNMDRITNETMIEPSEIRCWAGKIQRTVSLKKLIK